MLGPDKSAIMQHAVQFLPAETLVCVTDIFIKMEYMCNHTKHATNDLTYTVHIRRASRK